MEELLDIWFESDEYEGRADTNILSLRIRLSNLSYCFLPGLWAII